MYPYKVGEKVLYKDGNTWVEAVIAKIRWSEVKNSIFYVLNTATKTTIFPEYLKPMKQKKLKDYVKPGYVVEYDDGSRFVITQDVHGNNFGVQIGGAIMWADFTHLDGIVKAYQINRPGALHKTFTYDTHLTLVWERKEVELTMQQIADKFGIDVNQLKIKK
jgi:glycine/serine hydroxymethyltransferase